MQLLTSLIAGLVFGLGLIIAGMTDPSKVIGFLDLAGVWDPSLAMVMGGAVVIGLAAFQAVRGRTHSWLGAPLRLPVANAIDRRLVLGAIAFGVGWGLAGYCPGPALASLLSGGEKTWIFTAAMLVGMAGFETVEYLARTRVTS